MEMPDSPPLAADRRRELRVRPFEASRSRLAPKDAARQPAAVAASDCYVFSLTQKADMTEGVAERVKRLLHEHPRRRGAFHRCRDRRQLPVQHEQRATRDLRHPLHEQLVTDLRRAHAAHVAPTATA